MKKSSNTSSTRSNSKKRKYSLLLDELYRSADPVCIQAANEIQILYNTVRQNRRNYVLLINALREVEYVAFMRDKQRKVTEDQLERRLVEIVNICEDVKGILDEQ